MATMGMAVKTPDDAYAIDVCETVLFGNTILPQEQVRTAWNYVLAKMRDANLYEWKWGELVETVGRRIAERHGTEK
jgi:hypothetical protein